jgi:hypothetical protein
MLLGDHKMHIRASHSSHHSFLCLLFDGGGDLSQVGISLPLGAVSALRRDTTAEYLGGSNDSAARIGSSGGARKQGRAPGIRGLLEFKLEVFVIYNKLYYNWSFGL